MKLLANENIPLASVQFLRSCGLDIKAFGQEFSGISDQEVIQLAIEEERTIITFDRDYGELIFKHGYRPPFGVIYLRWKTFKPVEPGKYLISIIQKSQIDFSYALTVIDEDSIRQRKYRTNG
jgi:predicted nuclease of predicted toxin-antitoxin system